MGNSAFNLGSTRTCQDSGIIIAVWQMSVSQTWNLNIFYILLSDMVSRHVLVLNIFKKLFCYLKKVYPVDISGRISDNIEEDLWITK